LLQVLLGLRQLFRLHLRRPDFDAAAGHALDRRLVMTAGGEEAFESGVVGPRFEGQLEERAALELDARTQPADRQEEHSRRDEQRREQEVPPLPLDEVKEHLKSVTNLGYLGASATPP